MTLDECPVTIADLKAQLRLPDTDDFHAQLEVSLLSAAEWCENYIGRKLSELAPDGNFPYQLRAAILMMAAQLFENPSNPVAERVTAAERLADPKIWYNYGQEGI